MQNARDGFVGKALDPAYWSPEKRALARMRGEGVDVRDRAAVAAWHDRERRALTAKRVAEMQDSGPIRTEKKVGRNEPCPCESGKKFKKCCGAAG